MDEPRALHATWMRPSCQFHEHETKEDFNGCVIRVKMDRKIDY